MVRTKSAEESFKKALEAYRGGKPREAMALFEAAVMLDSRAKQDASVDPRYRSWYGLCLALEGGKLREGLNLCRKAAEEEFFNHEVWLNLGRVEMEAGHKEEAHEALRRGLHLAPGQQKKTFLHFLDVLGLRRRPFFKFLPRRHGLNVIVGRFTWRFGRKDDSE
jgi:tetratricopeptide (TPR) repeat protein